ncbi:hypothetical protein OAR76_02655 [Candidatus Pelagibacter sp.]|nr:hypothetical protein [Candidatus Pelagibacter sp.]
MISSSLKVYQIDGGPDATTWFIKSQTDKKKNWEYLLSIIEENTNLEIQRYLSKNFKELLSYHKLLRKYEIEDLENEVLRFIDNPTYSSLLKKKILNIRNNKNIERIEKIFADTPIEDQEKFYAGRISSKTSVYKSTGKETNFNAMIFMAGFAGLLLGVILIQIRSTFSKRKK